MSAFFFGFRCLDVSNVESFPMFPLAWQLPFSGTFGNGKFVRAELSVRLCTPVPNLTRWWGRPLLASCMSTLWHLSSCMIPSFYVRPSLSTFHCLPLFLQTLFPALYPHSPSHCPFLNRLTPNDPYMGRTAPLTSKRCILYIYSTNVGTEYFKHALHSPFFSFQNAVCFIMLTCLVPVLFIFYIQRVLKLKKIIPAPKG